MLTRFRVAGVSLTLALAASLPVAAEDLTIVAKVTANKGAPSISTTYLTTDRVRTSSPDQDAIVELKTGRFVFIDNKKKEYWETTAAEMEAVAKKFEVQMQQMAEQMKNMPAALRDKMGGGPPVAVTVEKGTGTKVVAGHTCQPYTVSMGDSMKIEMWVASDVEYPAQSLDSRKALFVGPMQKFAKVFEEMKKIKGYPLFEVTTMKIMGQTTESTHEVTAITKGAIAASAFEIPAGYKKKDSPFTKMR